MNNTAPDTKEPAYWDCCKDVEQLYHDTIAEAVQAHIDTICGPEDTPPETVTVYGFARMPIAEHECGNPLEHVLECLDEEYGDPDGDFSRPTLCMLEAERVFKAAVLAEYTSWACRQVCERVVNVKEYLDD